MIKVWTDASIVPKNPGGWCVAGFVLKFSDGTVATGTKDLGKDDPTMSNNVGEYWGVLSALQELLILGYTEEPVLIHSDSKLVVEQCNDVWQCSNDRLMKLRDEIWSLCEKFTSVEFKWIPREENQLADEISRSLY